MSRGPAIQEIFSNKALDSSNAFKFDEQETKENIKLGKKKTAAPAAPPMKKFGGYKPKILAEEDDFIEISPEPKANGALLSPKTRPAPVPNGELRDRPQLTKPKPWVIGDKDVPMVLETVDDGDDNGNGDNDDNNNNVEQGQENSNIYSKFIKNDDEKIHDVEDSQRTHSVSSSETSTLIHQDSYEPKQGIDNPAHTYSNDSLAMNGSDSATTAQMITVSPIYAEPDVRPDVSDPDEPEGVFIPPPDYDEEEKTLDFTSEDTDDPSDGGEDSKKTKQLKPRPIMKEYIGADLSHYLSDDEEDVPPFLRIDQNPPKPPNKQGKGQNQRPKVNEKHSLFKQQPHSTRSKRKSSKTAAPGFNSVRSFSYADSKFGTKGKAASKSMSFTELTDDSEKFLNTNDHASSYESFLRSRHGEIIPPPASNSSGVDLRDNGVNLRQKDENMLKRLTLRLKNRMSRNLSTEEH